MDKRNTYHRLKELLKDYQGQELSVHKLKELIMMNIGCDERTIQKCLNIMGNTNLIEDVDNCKFKVN